MSEGSSAPSYSLRRFTCNVSIMLTIKLVRVEVTVKKCNSASGRGR